MWNDMVMFTFIKRYCLIESNDGEIINYYLIASDFVKERLSRLN